MPLKLVPILSLGLVPVLVLALSAAHAGANISAALSKAVSSRH